MYELHWSRDQNRVKPKRLLIIFDHVPLTVPTKYIPVNFLTFFYLYLLTRKESLLELLALSCFPATQKRYSF